MTVVFTSVNVQLHTHLAAKWGVWKHPFNGLFNHLGGFFSEEVTSSPLL